jgi:phosphate transport system substrate-binding protein
MALVLMSGAAQGAVAATPLMLVQSDLADLRPSEVTGVDWAVTPGAELPNALCAARSDAQARLALASRKLTRRQREGCTAIAQGKLIELLIGRRAVLAMTGGASFALTSDILYRALASEVPGGNGVLAPNHAMRWRELDADLPDAPIQVLFPPDGSIEQRIVSEMILYEGCAKLVSRGLPADPIRRFDICTALRTDRAVTRATDKIDVAKWLHDQGDAPIALVGVAVLIAEPDLETALPLDGVIPNFANIADGRYRAALPVYLLTIMPRHTASSVAARVGPLLAETAIGPLGQLPRRGLAPLSAEDRVKLRVSLGREFEDAGD